MAISYLWQSGRKKEKEFELGQGWLTVMVVFRSFFFPFQLDSFAANDCQLERFVSKIVRGCVHLWWQIRSYIIKLHNINKLSSLSSTRFQTGPDSIQRRTMVRSTAYHSFLHLNTSRRNLLQSSIALADPGPPQTRHKFWHVVVDALKDYTNSHIHLIHYVLRIKRDSASCKQFCSV